MANRGEYVRVDDGNHSKRKNYIGALLGLLFLIASWVAMGELVQDVLTTTYDHPYFVIWTLHCGYIIWLWVIPFHYWCYGRIPLKITCSVWKKAFGLNCMLITADYLWYLSLKHTLVAVNNAIYQSNCAFVYLFSIVLLGEEFDIFRVLAMIVMLGGMLLIVLDSNTSSDDGNISTVGGYVTVILSVNVFAVYEIMFELFYPGVRESERNEFRPSLEELEGGPRVDRRPVGKNWETLSFVACMGIVNIFFMWIPLVIFNSLGVEEFKLPDTNKVIGKLFINAALGATYTSSYLVGIALSSPTFMSSGALLVVPVGVAADYVLNNKLVPLLSGIGCGVIGIGFMFWMLRIFWVKKDKIPTREGEPSYVTESG